MDPLTLLLVVVFFVLPLLQQVAEKRRKRGPRLPPFELPDEPADELPDGPRRRAPRVRLERGGDVGGWSMDWGTWPSEEPAAVGDAEAPEHGAPFGDRSDAAPEALPTPFEPRPREVAGPEPAASHRTPVVVSLESLESLEVDRDADRAPLQRRRAERASHPAPPRRRAPASLGRRLLVPGEARRAMLLAEVLGPPKALRSRDA